MYTASMAAQVAISSKEVKVSAAPCFWANASALAMPGHPQAEAAAQALHLGKHLAQGELFQAQRLCRGGKDDAFRPLFKIGAQLIKPLVEPFLRGEAEVGNPVVKALAGAHKANGQQELSPGQGMHHAHGLDGIAALPLAQGAHHLRHGVALAQGGLGAPQSSAPEGHRKIHQTPQPRARIFARGWLLCDMFT